MKKLKITALILCLLTAVNLFASCGDVGGTNNDGGGNADVGVEEIFSEIESSKVDTSQMDFEFTNRDNTDSYSENGAVTVKFTESGATSSSGGATVSGKTVTLTSESTYIVSGKSSDGMIIVNCGDNDKIQIVFDGLELTNKSGPAFYIKNADKVVITLAENSENSLSDGSSYEYADGSSNVDAALFSRADLTLNGSGSLTVNGNAKHGICSKDDLVFTGGSYNIKSANVALNGKDCVKISGGTFTLDAGSDGIRSDNEEDTDRGYVYISDGVFDITSGNDGIQAQTVLKIDGGEFDIKCGGGSANASYNQGGGFNGNWGFGGNDFGGRPGQNRPGFRVTSTSASSGESAKGVKAGSGVVIIGGDFNIDSADDAIHSNGTVDISDGTIVIFSGDDGIHGDTALTVSGGDITINKSYEGLESSDLVISGGKINVTATDDGLNAAGGNDRSALGNRPGMGGFTNSTGRIAITGGYMVVDAAGDGIDANGSVTVSGGVTIVYGPTNGGNGSLDYDVSAAVTGGTFIALGSSGMAQGFSKAENQGAIAVNLSGLTAGKTLSLCDEEGNVVVAVTLKKTASHTVISCRGVQSGGRYTLVAGAEIANADENGYAENTTKSGGSVLETITLTSNLYGSSGGMGGMQRPR